MIRVPRAVCSVLLLAVIFALSGCSKKGCTFPTNLNADSPADPGGAAPPTQFNNIVPNASFGLTTGNSSRVQLNLLGLIEPTTGKPLELVASNIYVSEDKILKGVKVTTPTVDRKLMADVVFVLDNSGSMGDEADSIASRIVAFASKLESKNIDLRVGCVGHGYNSDGFVYGALNLTTTSNLSSYLSRDTLVGVDRTLGFAGPDSAGLNQAAAVMGSLSSGENSVVALRYADANFAWRPGANRVYIAFTDEPTQPFGDSTYNTAKFLSLWQKEPVRGTVHMIFSEDTLLTNWNDPVIERPWALAFGTGGSVKFVSRNAADLDLSSLPVTGSIGASRLVEYVTSNPNGVHNVEITIKTSQSDGKRVYQNITYGIANRPQSVPTVMRPLPFVAKPSTGRGGIPDPRPRR